MCVSLRLEIIYVSMGSESLTNFVLCAQQVGVIYRASLSGLAVLCGASSGPNLAMLGKTRLVMGRGPSALVAWVPDNQRASPARSR